MNFRSKAARCCSRARDAFRPRVDVAGGRAGTGPCSRRGRASAGRRRARRGRARAGTTPSGPDLDEGQVAQPSEHLVGVVEREGVPQERLGGHPGQGARLQGAAPLADRDGVHEPPHERADQVGGQRVDGRHAAAARRRRRAGTAPAGGRGSPRPGGRARPARPRTRAGRRGSPPGPRFRSATTRSRSRHAGSARQAAPGGSRPAMSVSALAGRRGQQPGAHPVVQAAQPLVGVEQQDEPARAGAATASSPRGAPSAGAEPIQDGARRRRQVAAVEPDDDSRRRPARPPRRSRRGGCSCRSRPAPSATTPRTAARPRRAPPAPARARRPDRRSGAGAAPRAARRGCQPDAHVRTCGHQYCTNLAQAASRRRQTTARADSERGWVSVQRSIW